MIEDDEDTYRRGQFVRVTYCGKTLEAMITLASPNGRSLMLCFDGVLYANGGAYPGAMPVLKGEDGVYRDIVNYQPVRIEPLAMQ